MVLPYTYGAIKTSAVRGVYPIGFIHSLLHLQILIEHWWGLMGPPFQFMILSLLSLITQNLSLNQWTHFSPLIHYDFIWGPYGISVRYVAMFLDNFSPFYSSYEFRAC